MRSVFGVRSRSLELAERLAYVVNPDGIEPAITEDMDMRLMTVGVRRKGVLVDGMTLLAVAPKARMRVLDSLASGSKFWRIGVPQSPLAAGTVPAGTVPAGTVFRIENERSKPVDEEKAQLMANEDKANEDKAKEDVAKEDVAKEDVASEDVATGVARVCVGTSAEPHAGDEGGGVGTSAEAGAGDEGGGVGTSAEAGAGDEEGDEAGFDLFRDCVKLRALLHGGKPAPHTEAFLGDGLWRTFQAVKARCWKSSRAPQRIWRDTFGHCGPADWEQALARVRARSLGGMALEVCSSQPVTRSVWFELEPHVPEYWRKSVAILVSDDPEPERGCEPPETETSSQLSDTGWLPPPPPPPVRPKKGYLNVCMKLSYLSFVCCSAFVSSAIVLQKFSKSPPALLECLWMSRLPFPSLLPVQLEQLEEKCEPDRVGFEPQLNETCFGGRGGLVCRVVGDGQLRDVCYGFAGYEGRDSKSLWDAFLLRPGKRVCRIFCDTPGANLERLGEHVARALATNATLTPGWNMTSDAGPSWKELGRQSVRRNFKVAAAAAPHFALLPIVHGCSGYCSNCTRNTFTKLEKCPCGFAYAVCQSAARDAKPDVPRNISTIAGIQTTLKTVLHLMHELDHPKLHVDNCWYGCHNKPLLKHP
ncbi:hypothetical protein GNI_175550 [Gregarina niphandrodes]|uniref:Uncharacterized protein n=1 Tax=Gregarina niphandrodes TaxID=110365 RepID=A0A023AXK1_GRENI|nr:hypothetical protein GNI_175550 [Gregarina niphandrodes]EZG43364.1 hypothetical protein GNI_175550 [Gregarina niphandrodes]|eukprot:XP_011134657.1 hypothetical protein GNI_175550 [Gregarina niphandrodes]